MLDNVWVFAGAGGRFASGIFSDKDKAFAWISENKLTGVLTKYPLDAGVYQWAISEGYFAPKSDRHKTPEFIQAFSSASQEHYHFEDGLL